MSGAAPGRQVRPATDSATAIVIDGLDKRFGPQRALRQIDAKISTSSLTGLVGPDGAGKTTMLRLIAGLMRPSAGSIRVQGHDTMREGKAIRPLIGYMPQRFGLYEDLSVQENLNLYASLKGIHGTVRIDTFDRLYDFTRLGTFRKRQAGKLSGGMKQKLGLACALMAGPDVLLLDEPSVGVDPVSRRELWRMVQSLTVEGMTVLWSTAYLDEAERSESVILLNEGRVVFSGQPRQLTSALDGRSFLVKNIQGDRRRLLARALALDEVRDGIIQGDSVRLVAGSRQAGLAGAIPELAAEAKASLEPVAPRFEDAFIDRLGGGPGGRSVIAERMQPVVTDRTAMVECRELTRRFGEFVATDHISFTVEPGEVFGLLGPNGAGKSTTFKMLCGLLPPSSGVARVNGYDLAHSPGKAKAALGYMAQKFSLYGLLSVAQNLAFFAGAYGLRGRLRRERIDMMIDTFGLAPLLDQSPDKLPLGFKQRLALACALMHEPAVLFLDEPTSGVDPITRREFWTHISGLVDKGVTVLVTTHFMDEAEYCDRVALIHNAQLIELDTPDALKARLADEALPSPSMEDAFIRLVEARESDVGEGRAA